ncbi:CLIP-associating protein 1-like [Sinocyclocheilus grahami]|uniref:CLIP-associating protein 1-like n=1 Tax=Sinocyclocheilus grahami TaxID=75366 RepID=UPI0007AD2265|nr:PREDICTED: CLIP-associating protein 1-like [Sinocyclocheilus grahami]
MEPNMEYIVAQVTQKEVGRRFQVGPEIIDYILDRQKSHDLEHDQSMLDRMVDSLATSWVNASNFKVALLGMDIVSALVTRLQERFKTLIGTVLPSLIDRLGDSKDQVRDQAQSLLLKIMDQAANPQYVWDRMLAGFRHKNNRTREAVCFCLIATLNASGAQGLTLSKIVPHICHLLGDPASQVRDGAMNCLVEIYRHVGERVRVDLGKKGLPQSRLNVIFSRFDGVQRSGNMILSSDKNMDDEDSVDGGRSSSSVRKESSSAGAVDEEDFIRAFEDVPAVQIYSARELEDSMNKIRETLSDDKHDWEQRVVALKKVRSLLLAGASEYDGFSQQLRQLEGPLKLSAKDLRSQVVREACITLGHLSSVLGNKFDHGAENIMPTLLNLVPNSAKVMATSGMAVIRLIIRVFWEMGFHRSKVVSSRASSSSGSLQRSRSDVDVNAVASAKSRMPAVAATAPFSSAAALPPGSYASLDAAGNVEGRVRTRRQSSKTTAGGGASVTDSRGRSRAKAVSQSQRSRSANPVVGKTHAGSRSSSPGKLLARSSMRIPRSAGSAGAPSDKRSKIPRSQGCSRETSPSHARNGKTFTSFLFTVPRQGSRSANPVVGKTHAGSRSSSPGKLLARSSMRIPRSAGSAGAPSDKRSKIPRSQGCSRETSPSHARNVRASRIPRPSMSQGCSRDTSRESSRDTSPARGFSPLASHRYSRSTSALTAGDVLQTDRFGLIHQAMRILNTGTEVEAAVADALLLGDSRNKVKVAILKYIESLARQMDPSDFVNSSETRLAVSRIITWTTDPKSSDVRKAAQMVLIALFELNTPEFTMLLGALPKTFQDGATKLLHNHLKNSSNAATVSQASPSGSSIVGRTPPRHPVTRSSPLTSPTNGSHGGMSPSMLEYDTENMNSEEIFSSLRGVTEAIQSFSFRSQEGILEPIKHDGKRDDTTGVDPRLSAGVMEGGRTALDNKTSLLNTPSPRSFSGPWAREYNQYNYSDSISAYEKGALAVLDDVEHVRDGRPQDCGENKILHPKGFSAGPRQHLEMIGDLLKELSNHSERVEERRAALLELLKVTRDDSLAVWEEHFKTMLLLLLETLGDRDHTIRALALRVLKEIMRSQPARFKNYAELTIMKTLEAHKDCHKEVVRAAEETASTLAGSIHSEQCIKVLCPIIQTADYPINLAAIKMQTKVIERILQDSLIQLLPDIIPGLLQGYDNTESSVRKASVFCLVAIYSVIGEDLKPHLQQLTGSKMKLLNLYIKRAQITNSNSSSSSDVSSHS